MSEEKKKSWFQRLKSGLAKSTDSLTSGITGIFTKGRLDEETLEELEDLLITTDLGVAAAARICAVLAKDRYNREITDEEVRSVLAAEIETILTPVAKPLEINPENKPHVILMVGVNGSGKTTTIGKLAQKFRTEGKSVMMAAGDTFRAAAIEQLQAWGERAGVPVVSTSIGGDAAALAFEAMDKARMAGTDILLVDTAGRLQNKTELMEELAKIVRIIGKKDETAPHSVILVLDASTGQNILSQVEVFQKAVHVTGLIMTKLDGSARGGVLVAAAEKFGLPVHAIGVGESIDDLEPFDAAMFAKTLVALTEENENKE